MTSSANIYEEIEIEDMEFDEDKLMYTYPCPCGDKFIISLEELLAGEDIAKCPSCTLRILVIYDIENLPEIIQEDDDDDNDDDNDKADNDNKHNNDQLNDIADRLTSVAVSN